jgi:general secretion pathway protein A
MFLEFYNLREQPFGVTPDPRFLFLTETHREALASLFYVIEEGRGFGALVAPPGMGKTTLLFQLMERLRGSASSAFLFQTRCDSREFLRYLLTDMGVDCAGDDLVKMHEKLNSELLRLKHSGTRFVLVIDEAQNLNNSVLESVRLLSDFETSSSKLMQIILAGQPGLGRKLASPQMTQLRQRVSVWARLRPLTAEQIDSYIDHRLRVAGYIDGPLFTSQARALIATCSGGIPRNINSICFNALSLGYALEKKKIDGEIITEVAADLDLRRPSRDPRVAVAESVPVQQHNRPRPPAFLVSDPRGHRTLTIAVLAFLVLTAGVLTFSLFRRRSEFMARWLEPALAGIIPTGDATATLRPPSERDSARASFASGFSPSHLVSHNVRATEADPSSFPEKGLRVLSMASTRRDPTAPGNPVTLRPSGKPVGSLPTSARKGRRGDAVGMSENSGKSKHPQSSKVVPREAARQVIAAAPEPRGLVRFVTVPSGAQVFIDGKSVGSSPVESSAAPGWHTYRVLAPWGEKDISGTFRMEPAAVVVETVKWNAGEASQLQSLASAPLRMTHEQGLKDLLGPEVKANSNPADTPETARESAVRKGPNNE